MRMASLSGPDAEADAVRGLDAVKAAAIMNLDTAGTDAVIDKAGPGAVDTGMAVDGNLIFCKRSWEVQLGFL